ncbi:hypothetical protein CBR_g3464 [Chara braunii]|uniref:Rtel1 helicase ARCH domain-containing protein n=1 Tax=Chara braunii TaxID=69332 RepID=A0A388JR12_CHABU|nr:hypothetical protein CBR_g3464 [Chara braunii]|eukprot:GBG60221.1 hypothetical protein CBR_g3464 [Chara braunii]
MLCFRFFPGGHDGGPARGYVTCRLQLLKEALEKVFCGNAQETDAYKVHVHDVASGFQHNEPGEKKYNRTLSYWCFDPGLCMKEFVKLGVKTILLTSGTLAPLESFAQELKLPFQIQLENPHVIPANHVWIGVVRTGPSGVPLNSSYRNRDSIEYKIDLGNAIVNWARIVPDGLLVFFPSYSFLTTCIKAWKTMRLSSFIHDSMGSDSAL